MSASEMMSVGSDKLEIKVRGSTAPNPSASVAEMSSFAIESMLRTPNISSPATVPKAVANLYLC